MAGDLCRADEARPCGNPTAETAYGSCFRRHPPRWCDRHSYEAPVTQTTRSGIAYLQPL
jgi:hypothetical protein